MTTKTPGLRISSLEKRFGAHRVVRGLHLELAQGEIVALLGPSGCGKTTALRIVAGLEAPDSGTVEIAGTVVRSDRIDVPPERRGVGMVFQSYAVWPHKSVRENVAYPLRLAKDRDAAAKADEMLSLVALVGMGDRFPETLSGGQQQRVALARALVAHPSLLLFDEPLSNLDAKLREEMRHEIRQLAKRLGITTLYVTHDQGEAFAVSDRVAVVLEGVIAQSDVPTALYTYPRDLRVARFVGRMSVLDRVTRAAGDTVVLDGRHRVACTFADGCGDGDLVLGVRPEAVTLATDPSKGLDARVLRSTFLGERIEVCLETPSGELRADLPPALEMRDGDCIRVAIASGRVFGRRT